jgi:hypothetical protein
MDEEEDAPWDFDDLVGDAENDRGFEDLPLPVDIDNTGTGLQAKEAESNHQSSGAAYQDAAYLLRGSESELSRDGAIFNDATVGRGSEQLSRRRTMHHVNSAASFTPGACLLSRPPLTGSSVSVVLPDESLWFIAISDDEPKQASDESESLSLLEVPVEELLAKLDAEALTGSAAANQRTRDLLAPAGRDDVSGDIVVPPSATTAALWVDRYSPRGFLDLLSSDQVNRNVLRSVNYLSLSLSLSLLLCLRWFSGPWYVIL